MKSWAEKLRMAKAVELIAETLVHEKATDAKLSSLDDV